MKKHSKKLILALLICCIAFICSISISTADQKVYAATKVKLNKKSVTLTEGKSITLKLKGTTKKAKWTSNKKKVATVNQKGKVTAKKAGKAKITAKAGKKKYTCTVTVVKSKTPEQPKPGQPKHEHNFKYEKYVPATCTENEY